VVDGLATGVFFAIHGILEMGEDEETLGADAGI
jgi:hypothetical protein